MKDDDLKKETGALSNQLGKLWFDKQQQLAQEWNRSLPFGDVIVDRKEKAKFLGYGDGTTIYDCVLTFGDIIVGEDTWIGPFVILDGSGGLSIGSNCSISAGVQIYSHDSVQWAITGGKSNYEYAKTTIGNNCYIGPNTVISKGVTIGDRCIIGANSLVLKDIPSDSKAFGSPCMVKKASN